MPGIRYLTGLVALVAALGAVGCAPTMPVYPTPAKSVWLDQGWTKDQQFRYHRTDQGTLTFGVPYEWFVALEQPVPTLNEAPLLSDKSYLNRFGFIPGESPLPVGFARGADYRNSDMAEVNGPGGGKLTGVGLTCAACHTGRMTYKGTELLIDGGSALTDVVGFNQAFVVSLLYTKYIPFRFERFARRVLGDGASAQDKEELRRLFDNQWAQTSKVVALERATTKGGAPEGFGRLDAINRIGNRVFSVDMGIDQNYVPRTAPVHYPHIWDAPWFTWVQYNGSIMQPMVRNAGEALGVGALINLKGDNSELFNSTVHVTNLHTIEQFLAGAQPPWSARKFSGLHSPRWSYPLPDIKQDLADKGAVLYKENCQGCHLPPPSSAAFWKGAWWTQIDGKGERYLDLHQIPIAEIGTDPEQARGMAERTVILSERMKALPASQKFKSVMFGDALGQMVQNVTGQWYNSQKPPTSAADREVMNGGRPNDLQVKLEYKARPLNGIWATPPYLHNGSVPSLYALLSPVAERPSIVNLGNREFDPNDVGYKNEAIAGGFALDTSLKGNRNTGHEFRDGPKGEGVIGRGFSPEERRALIEYLKTL
jgi:mono/diheme cytochrome c family protein